MDIIERYFPDLSPQQRKQYQQLDGFYREWNEKVNVISRKDIDHLYLKHVLHSMLIAKYIQFRPATRILDVGTGGGFPGIPLAILFPDSDFYLVDSIGKKIKVVNALIDSLGLENCRAEQVRAEKTRQKFDFVVSRAVTAMPVFLSWVKNKIDPKGKNEVPNGILALKGGDLSEELKLPRKMKVIELRDYVSEDFFETKKLVHIFF